MREPRRVTQVVYEIFNGPLPEGATVIMHRWDITPCVHPIDLMAGSRSLNMVDMIAKGRQLRKLTADQVRDIRADTRTNAAIAAELGVARATLLHARIRRTWAWLD